MLTRIFRNIRWLFNHPPVTITGDIDPEEYTCDYFGASKSTWTTPEVTFCLKCQKKVYDSVLLKKSK